MGCNYPWCRGVRVTVGLGHVILLVVCLLLEWVRTDDAHWTLWNICTSNISAPNPGNYSLKEQGGEWCAGLGSGSLEIPGFFQAIRVLLIMMTVNCFLQLFICVDNEGMDKGKRPAVQSFISGLLGIIVVIVAFACAPQEEGEFFHGDNQKLSLGVYLVIISICISSVLVFITYKYDQDRVQAAKAKRERPSGPAQLRTGTDHESAKSLQQPRRLSVCENQSSTGGVDSVLYGAPGASSHLPKRNAVGPGPLLPPIAGSAQAPSDEALRRKRRKKKRRQKLSENQQHLPDLYTSGGGARVRADSPLSYGYQTNHGADEFFNEDRLYSGASPGAFTTNPSLENQTRSQDEEAPVDEQMYLEDLRSASRASVLHNQEMRDRGRGKHRGETPLLDAMPVYTLPPSADHHVPARPRPPPPSYDSVTARGFVDMPAPPVVAVPVSVVPSQSAFRYT